MVTHNPLYGSGQAGLPHPALTSGDNAHAAQEMRMTSAGGRQPAVDQAPHAVPKHDAEFVASAKIRHHLRTVDDVLAWQAGDIRA